MTIHKFDAVVITGCSFSAGMEMNDYKLENYKDNLQRQALIWKWAKTQNMLKSKDLHQSKTDALFLWQQQERDKSWPAKLQEHIQVPVHNLARIGGSIGQSLLAYSNFLQNYKNKYKKICAVHQIPSFSRMCVKFNKEFGRINVTSGDIEKNSNFGFDKNFYKKEIEQIHRYYKEKIITPNYLEKYFNKILLRIKYLSVKNNIDDFFIFATHSEKPNNFVGKILIKDLEQFRKQYAKGTQGHPVDPQYNIDMCKKILPIF